MNERKKPALYLVDGSNYLFRAFYAIRELSNSKGFPTNAIYGFTTMLLKLLRDNDPEYIAVAFDVKGPTFRHEAYDGYKATRKATPDAIIPQIPYVKEIVRAFGIPILEQGGIEADDIIGTLAARYANPEMQVAIVSGDKDLLQLVGEHVTLIDTMKDKRYDAKAVKERFGVEPAQVVDILALAGDSSDNIPGVPGIGAKGAQRLIQEFGTVDNILANLNKVKNGRAKAALEAFADQAKMSRELAKIRLDAEISFHLEESRRKEPDTALLKKLFSEFEFSSLLQDLQNRPDAPQGVYRTVLDSTSLRDCLDAIQTSKAVAMELALTSPEPMRAEIAGIGLSIAGGEACYIPIPPADGRSASLLTHDDIWTLLSPVLADETIQKSGHDLKSAGIALARQGVSLLGRRCDTLMAAYVLNPSRRSFDIAQILVDYAGHNLSPFQESGGPRSTPPSPEGNNAAQAASRAAAVWELTNILLPLLEKDGIGSLYRDMEMPLIPVLERMERHGVLLDTRLLKTMSRELRQLMELSAEKIYRLAGEQFNINSSKQLQVILFDKMKLPRGRKTKEGYSTDVEVLTQLAKSHELPGEILAYRSLAKLKSTYIDALPALVNPATGRIHTSYNQAVTATGRLSSSNPNLQNIPVRTLEGKRIRQAFIAPEGCRILSADYSQIELRILAHLSGDNSLLAAFASGEDIHSRTASDIFGVFPEMVNDAMRRQAKVINFGILYGMSAFGLSRELDISQKLAQAYIDEYFRKYEGVRIYLEEVINHGRREGYVTTLMGRRRYLPELNADHATVRQFAERMAVNTPIQGTAADLIKMAMIRIDNRLLSERMKTHMIMQVHDELVFEVPDEERETLAALVAEEMEGVMALRIPLKVDIGCGNNWDEAHG